MSSDFCDADSPFNYDVKPGGFLYKRQKLGVNCLGNFMKITANKAGLQGRKTNHAAHKACVTTLPRAKVPETQIMHPTY